jgi:flagellar biosynthesis protein FliQ
MEPSLVFGFLIATLCGAAVHLVFGGDARQLALSLMASWLGAGIGHVVGVLSGFTAFNTGTLRTVPMLIGIAVALVVVNILILRRPRAS